MHSNQKFFFRVFLFLILGTKAQVSQSVIIDKINTKELTNPFVSALFQDEKGYLWVGTIGGLNKYNGYTFARYRCLQNDSNSLSNPAITCFHQTEINSIFVGTRGGLNIYNYNTDNFKRIVYSDKLKNAGLKNNINCIVSNSKLEKILGTDDGILWLNDKSNILQTISYNDSTLLEGWSVSAMCIDRLGNLWACANKNTNLQVVNKVFKYSFVTQILSEIPLENNTNHCGVSEDYLGNIWVAADNGLIYINPGTNKSVFYEAPGKFYSNVSYTHTKDNFIWQCYWSFGLTAFDIDKKEFVVYSNNPDKPKSLMSNKCWALLKDANDIFWIGSDVGLQKITNKRPGIDIVRKNNRNEKNSFKGNIINSVLASKTQNNIVFVGIDGEGFSIYNRLTKLAENFGPNAENKNTERLANQFIEDNSGDVYVLGQNNFQKISFKSGSANIKGYFEFQEHYCASGITDPLDSSKIWVGGKGEIFCFDKKTQTSIFYPLPEKLTTVFYSAFVYNNHIYFGYKNGLLKINSSNNKFEKINLNKTGNISAALILNENEILLSSQFLGLIKYYPKSNKFDVLFNKNNEYFSEPSSLLLYKNNIWLTGNGGLTCINLTTEEITEITTEDGLPSSIVHKTDMLDGYFYLGTHEGLAIINPDFQVSHFIAPKIDLTSFLVLTDNTTYGNLKSGDEITLTEKQNSFKINFTVLDFNLPEKNRFKFKLLPIQKEWQSPVGENFLIFNSLPPGNYTFELLGSNADQIWSLEPFIIHIKIIPPFYKTTWFYPMLAITIIILGILYTTWRASSSRKKREMLEKIIKARTTEIQEQKAELLDSIIYAKRIQKAIFEGEKLLYETVPNSFIFYKPKSKVSGDFYWIGKYKDLLIVFAGDCTGHGVPGAMLSIVGTTLLNKIVHEENIYLPGEILTRLNFLFYNQLSLDVENVRDGIDASVITINTVNHSVYFSGAKLDAICITNNTLVDLKSHRISIGEDLNAEFKTQHLPAEANRTFYLFSDGIKDQHGGTDKKKLSIKKFKEIILEASNMPLNEQKRFVFETINSWKGNSAQTDDMILIGFKI